MENGNWQLGSKIVHPLHGEVEIVFVGDEYIGLGSDDGLDALVRRSTLAAELARKTVPEPVVVRSATWLESTFVNEDESADHRFGSRWLPFATNPEEVALHMQDVFPQALRQTGYGEDRSPERETPVNWEIAYQFVWPLRNHGVSIILQRGESRLEIVAMFPFVASGSQQRLTMDTVNVWQNGVEAQITADWGGGSICFYDTQFLINRLWYEHGRKYDFILTGIAYQAAPAKKHEWVVNRHPEMLAWMNRNLKDGEEAHPQTVTVNMDGAAMLRPIENWDSDDYQFHAPIKSVTEFKDWREQDGWRVRATVMRSGDEDHDLDIIIMRKTWPDDAPPPSVGQDIEGALWLQGYLWMPLRKEAAR